MSVGIRSDFYNFTAHLEIQLWTRVTKRLRPQLTVLLLHKPELLVRESKKESRTMTRGYYSELEP